MTEYTDHATILLTGNRESVKSSGVPVSTLHDQDHGRISKKKRAANQQYLRKTSPSKNGHPLPTKYLRSLAWKIYTLAFVNLTNAQR
jgi:hypothetical protein